MLICCTWISAIPCGYIFCPFMRQETYWDEKNERKWIWKRKNFGIFIKIFIMKRRKWKKNDKNMKQELLLLVPVVSTILDKIIFFLDKIIFCLVSFPPLYIWVLQCWSQGNIRWAYSSVNKKTHFKQSFGTLDSCATVSFCSLLT